MAYTYPVRSSRPMRSNSSRNQDDEERRRREEEERRKDAEIERARQKYEAAGKERNEQELYNTLYGNSRKSQEPEQAAPAEWTSTRKKYPSKSTHSHGLRPDSKQERIEMSMAETQRREELAADKAARREESRRRNDALYGYNPSSPAIGGTKQRIYWNMGNDPETAKKLDQFRYVYGGNIDPTNTDGAPYKPAQKLSPYEKYMQANIRNREVNNDDLSYAPLNGSGKGMTPEKWAERENQFANLTENQTRLLDDLKTKQSQNESLEMMGSYIDDDGRIASYANDAARQEEEDIRNKLRDTGLSDEIIDEYIQNDGKPQRTIEEELQLDSYYTNQLDKDSKAVLNDYLDWDEKEKLARESGNIGTLDPTTGAVSRNDADVAARQKELLKEQFMYRTGQSEEEFELTLERARRVYDYNRNIDQQNELHMAQKEGGAGEAIGQNLAVIAGSLGNGLGVVKDTLQGQYDPAAPSNIYGDNFAGVNEAANIQQITAANIGDAVENRYGDKELMNILGHSITPRSVAEFAYQTGMSTAESALQMAAMAPVAGLAPGSKIGSQIASTAAMAPFGYNSYASSLKENLENGMTQSDAQTMALVSGAAEIITEKFSADKFWDILKQNNATARKRVVDFLMSSVIEGSEEVASDVINDAADIILMGDYSENRQKYDEFKQKYLHEGMSEKDAERAAWGDFLNDKAYEYGQSGLGGFVSGGVHGATATAVNIAQTQKAANTALQNGDFDAVAQSISTNEEDYRNKSALDSAKAAKQMAEKYAEQKASGKEVTGRQVRKLYEAMQDALNTEAETENSIKVPEPEAADERFEQMVVDQYAGKGNNISARDAVAAMARAQTPEQLVMVRKAAEASRDSSARAAAQAAYQLNKGRIASENNLVEADFEAAENAPTESEAFEAGIRGEELAEGSSEALQRAYKSGEMVSRLRAGREGANAAEAVLRKDGTTVNITGITGFGENMKVHTSGGDVSVRDMATSATKYLYEAASKYGSEKAAQNFIENYDGKMPVGRYTSIFDKYYAYGGTNARQFEDVYKNDKIAKQFMNEDQLRSIYKYGQAERAAQLKNNAAEQGKSIAVRGTGVVKDNRKVKTDIEYMPVLEAMARATGMDIVLADDMADNINGTFNRAMQAITLNTKNKDNVLNTLFHEGFGEVMQAHNAEGAARVQQAVFDYIAEDEDMLVRLGRAYQDAYIGVEGTKTFYDAMSEMVNDSIAGLFSTEEGIHDFAEWAQNKHGAAGAKTILQSTADYFKGIADSFKRLLQKGGLSKASQRTARMAEDRAREIRKMILQEMDVAIENARKAGIDPNAESGQAYSAKVLDALTINGDKLKVDRSGDYAVSGSTGMVVPIVKEADFTGNDVRKEYTTVQKLLREELLKLRGAKITIKSDGSVVLSDKKFSNEYVWSKDTQYASAGVKRAKANIYSKIVDIVENAVNPRWAANTKPRHKTEAARGWRYYDVTFAINDNGIKGYVGKLNVRMDANGSDYIYDITDIKNVPVISHMSGGTAVANGLTGTTNTVPQPKHSVNVDSAGNALFEAQAEYFKDSKVRDENGNLLLVHHGTNAEFYEFDRNYIGSHGSFEGAGFNFTPSETRAGGYKGIGSGEGRVMSGYLNITSPLSDSKVTLSASKLAKLIRDIDPTGDDIISNYARDTRDYGSPAFISRESLYTARQIINYSESDADIYSEMSAAGADANTIIEAFKAQGYDGLIHHTDDGKIKTLIAFDSNQFKNKDNTSPTTSADIRHSINAAMEDIYGDNVQIETDQNGEFQLATAEGSDTIIFNDADMRYSLKTVDNTKSKLEEYLLKRHDPEDVRAVLKTIDDYADFLQDVASGYEEMNTALNTDVFYDVTGKRQVLRSLLKNGEYPVNIDFMTICKKRQAYMRVLTDLIDDGTFAATNFSSQAIAAVNDVLRDQGYETACLACFVESRRLQIQKWSETFCEAWNRQVEKVAGKNAKPFDFGKNAKGTTSYSSEELQKLADEFENAGKKNDKGNLILEAQEGEGKAVERKMADLLHRVPSLARTLQPGDILKTNGVANLRTHYGDLYSLLLQWYGSNTPKVNQDFNPYNGEFMDLGYDFVKTATGETLKGSQKYKGWAKSQIEEELGHALSKKENEQWAQEIEERAIRKYLYDIGGARLQSFSDFLIENTLDYIQMVGDLAARKFPMHAYSKEISFIRIFGMTGMKLNMSLIPVINRAAGKKMAGLNPDGSYAGWGDFERHMMMNGNSFIQSIGWKDAIAMQLDPRYSKNIGTIAIGISDAHIRKMLDDPLIRMIIPYHKSGIKADYAKRMNVDYYTNYEKYQVTKVRQFRDMDGRVVKKLGDNVKYEKDFNFNEAAQRLGDARAAANEYLQWCREGQPVYIDDVQVGTVTFIPEFEQFSDHRNYYKVLEDFNMYDAVTEEAAPQGAVTMTFRDENHVLSERELQEYADRLRATGQFTEREISKYVEKARMDVKDIIRNEAAERNSYRRRADANYDATYQAIKDELKKYGRKGAGRHSVEVADAANVGYHAGDLGKAESLGNQSGNRGTGHFGTGTYFVGSEADLTGDYAKRPHEAVDFSNYNLYQPGDYKRGMALHEFLKGVNDFFDRGENEARTVDEWERRVDDLRSRLWDREGDQDELIQEATDLFGEYAVEDATDGADDIYDALDRMIDRNGGQAERVVGRYERWHESMPVNDLFGISAEEADSIVRDIRDEIASANYSIQERYTADSASTRFMKRLGYEGVDVRGVDGLDNTMYGSVIYDLKGEALQKKYANGARYSVNVDTEGRGLSDAQQEYFKDSMMLDDEGRLKVMYHGSPSIGFTVFDPSFSKDEISLFFTDSTGVARSYSGSTATFVPDKAMTFEQMQAVLDAEFYGGVELDRNKAGVIRLTDHQPDGDKQQLFDNLRDAQSFVYDMVMEQKKRGPAGNYKVYLNLENPLIIDANGSRWNDIHDVPSREVLAYFDLNKENQTVRGRFMSPEIEDAGKGPIYEEVLSLEDFREKYTDTSAAAVGELLLTGKSVDAFTVGENFEPLGQGSTTRDISEEAYEAGYDGVIFKNLIDIGDKGGVYEPSTVAIAFNSNQVKSVENQNPTGDEDIRRSVVVDDFFGDSYGMEDSYTQMTLAGAGSILEDGAKALKGKTVDEKLIRGIASELRNKYGSTYDLNTFAENLRKVFAYAQGSDSVDYNDLMNLVREVAQPVIDEATQKVGQEEYDAFLAAIGNQKIRLTDRQKDAVREIFGSYPNFQRAMRGIRINDNGDVTLDQIWNELVDAVPGVLDYDVTEGDMPLNLYDALATLKPTVRNMYGENNEEAAADLAMEIVEQYYEQAGRATGNEAAKAAAQRMREQGKRYRERVRERYNERLKEAKERLKEQRKQYGEKVRADRDQKIAEMRAKNRQRAVDIKERREAARQRDMVNSSARKLMQWTYNPNDQHHIPKSMLAPVAEFLSALDFVDPHVTQNKKTGKWVVRILNHTVRNSNGDFVRNELDTIEADSRAEAVRKYKEMLGRGLGSRAAKSWQQRMQVLQDLLENIKNERTESRDLDDITSILDKDLADELRDLLQRNRDVLSVSNLNAADLKILNKVLRGITHAINVGNKAFMSNDNIRDLAEDTMTMAKNDRVRRKDHSAGINKILDNITLDMATPLTYFKMLGEGGHKVYKGLRQALNTKVADIRTAQEYFEEQVGKDAAKQIQKWTGKKAEIHEFQTVDGTIRMTTAQIMSLYELSKRQQAMLHTVGGFTPSTLTVNKKEVSQPVMHLTEDMIREITDTLTPEQKRIADALQQFMANQCSDWGNDAALTMYGYEKFSDPNYFPISVDKNTVSVNNSTAATGLINAIKNSGFTKQVTPNANNPLVVHDIFDVFTNHVTDMATYHGFAPAITDALRWFNYRTVDTDEQTSFNYRQTVQGAVEAIYGQRGGKQYFVKLIGDLNQMEKSTYISNGMVDTLVSHYKVAAVGGNLRVVIQQPTAYARALNTINGKYLLRAMAASPKAVMNRAAAAKDQNMIAWWKGQGYYETAIGKSMKEMITGATTTMDKIRNLSTAAAGVADDITWGALYRAVELEQADIFRREGNSTDSEEYRQAVNDRFDDLVDETQVVDATLLRSQYMRSQDMLNKLQTAFMAEPMKSYNMLLQSAMTSMREKNAKPIVKSAVVFTATSVLTALAAGLVDAFRRDDDETSWFERWLKASGANFGDNINPLGLMPVIKDFADTAVSIIAGETTFASSSARMDIDAVNNMLSAAQKTVKYFNRIRSGEGPKANEATLYGVVKTDLKALSQLTGVPLYALWRDLGENLINAFGYNLQTNYKPYDRLHYAINTGEFDVKEEVDTILDSGRDKGDISTSLKKKYGEALIDTQGTPEGDELRQDILDALVEAGYEEDKANAKIESWINPDAEEESGGEEYVSEYQGVYDAIDSGSDPAAAVQELLSAGKKASSVKTTITRRYKDDMIDLYSSGDMKSASALKQQLIVAYMAAGMTRDEANKKINEWLGL